MSTRAVLLIALWVSCRLAGALPTSCISRAGDATYSQTCAALAQPIVCPTGFTGAKNGCADVPQAALTALSIVLLVHGTGSTGNESWAQGPYVALLPKRAAVDVCYTSLPYRSLGDAQVSAEYVAYAISSLAPKSKTGKVTAIGHSQGGGFNVQFALLYWPSTRKLVSNCSSSLLARAHSADIALSGDFKGTALTGPLVCAALRLAEGGQCCACASLPQR